MASVKGFSILDSRNDDAATADEAERVNRLCSQNAARRMLADVSNLPQKQRVLVKEEKQQSVPGSTKEYLEQLEKENLALVNILARKNKIIAERGTELERLKVNMIKAQEQNRKLALSHTQILTELNLGKDRLKALQHELGCATGLLKASKLELEGNDDMRKCHLANVKPSTDESIKLQEGCTKEGKEDERKHTIKRKQRAHSLGSSDQSEANAAKHRPTVRRQSARFNKSVELKHAKDSLETPKSPMPGESASENTFIKGEDVRISGGSFKQESGRSSLCRPSRQAAKKVQSYKEIPLNVKMRRLE